MAAVIGLKYRKKRVYEFTDSVGAVSHSFVVLSSLSKILIKYNIVCSKRLHEKNINRLGWQKVSNCFCQCS